MDKRITVFGLLATVCILSVASMRYTMAFFTDTATSGGNTFAAAASFDTVTPTISESTPTPTSTESEPTATPLPTSVQATVTPTPLPGKIVINEVFEGSSSAEWVELFNSGGSPVDVSGWTITDNTSTDILPTTSPIAPGGYAVIVTSGSSVVGIPGSAITIVLSGASSGTIGNGLANGGDRLTLQNGLTAIDQMSWGTDLTVFNPGPNYPSAVNSLRRIPNGVDTDVAGDWVGGISSIGVSN